MLPQAVVPNSACGPVEDGGRLPSHVSPRDPHASRRRDTLAGVAVAVAPGRAARPLPFGRLVVASHGQWVCAARPCHSVVSSDASMIQRGSGAIKEVGGTAGQQAAKGS